MCGIAGVFLTDPTQDPEPSLRRMTLALRHRGPDDIGVVLLGEGDPILRQGEAETLNPPEAARRRGGLGHTRLSILDLKAGRQPFSDPSGRHWVVYNGEIYNHASLRAELESTGWVFRTTSDTEVLVACLARWGLGALDRLEGMFAFAWWDDQERSLVLARDRLGIKPLYYASLARGFAFASEIKALATIPGVDLRIDADALEDFFVHRYVPSPRTIHRGIKSLPPGHYMRFRPEDAGAPPTPVRWWSPLGRGVRGGDFGGAVEELDALLGEVCRDHLISDVPVGCFLSGGVDSSVVAAHAGPASPGGLKGVWIGFRGMAGTVYNERKLAEEVARALGVDLAAIELDGTLLDSLPAVVAAMDQPMADPSILPTYMLMKAARTERKVMLSGDGGDEVFGGYNRYLRILRHRDRGWMEALGRAGRSLFGWKHDPVMARYMTRMEIAGPGTARGLLRPEFHPKGARRGLGERIGVDRDRDPLARMQQFDLQTYLVDDNLAKVDLLSMAFGLEVRVPLLDRRIVEFGLSLPPEHRAVGGLGKAVLRECLKRRLPAGIADKKKVGFKVPLETWFPGGASNDALTRMLEPSNPLAGILEPERVRAWINQSGRGERRYQRLFSLMVLDAWLGLNPGSRG